VLWAAGVEAPPLSKTLGVETDRSGRIKVQPDLSIPAHPDAYVIGDLAWFPTADGGSLPGLAPVALQMGTHVAAVIRAGLSGQPKPAFVYRDKGIMATVGRASGIAQSGRLRLSGMLGWLAWLFIHILFLIGFRNRVLVMFQWAWAWFTFGRSARLITGTTPVPAPRPVTHAADRAA
jgi:NADH dehydrogenase